jgi:hypothetical protein
MQKWLETIGPHLDVVFAWGTVVDPFIDGRMKVRCKKCDQTLTSNVPQDSTNIDWALQRFVHLHTHKQVAIEEIENKIKRGIVKEMTADFKLVPKPLMRKEGRRFREDNQ